MAMNKMSGEKEKKYVGKHTIFRSIYFVFVIFNYY